MSELEQYFEYKCRKGMEKLGYAGKHEYEERLTYEIEVIKKTGFCGYFLILADILDWARSVGIPVGPGRGSAAGSLAVHCLGITNRQLDPLKYGLLFERFLNPERIGLPDIDIDLCENRRDEVIQHLQETYGYDKVAHIGTYGTMKARAAIRETARVLGYPAAGDKLARLVLQPIAGKSVPLQECYEEVPELKQARHGGGPEQNILEWAEKFEGQIKSFGTHAGGIILSEQPITRHLPIYRGKDKKPTSQFEMNNVEEVGLVKFDFLSIRGLTTISRCKDFIKEHRGIDVDIDNVDIEDQGVFEQLQTGDVEGIFQLEGSSGMRDLILKIKPTCLDDLAAAVAIYRPGPLGSNMLDKYLACRAGTDTPNYLIPELEPILGKTLGWSIYQEQILEIAKQLAGYTGGQADELRKAVGKKKRKLMEKHEKLFREGMKNNGFDESIADRLYHDIQSFAEYGFNRAHAVSYAFISYQMAYLRYHYPAEFICACLVGDSDEQDKVIRYINWCRSHNMRVLPPSVNSSGISFSIENGKDIRFGLKAIKYVGAGAKLVIREREKNGSFKSLLDFCTRMDLSRFNKKKLEALIQAGGFDEFGETRAALLEHADKIWNNTTEQRKWQKKQETYENRLADYYRREAEIKWWESLTTAERKELKQLYQENKGKHDSEKRTINGHTGLTAKPGRMKLPEPPEKPPELTFQPREEFPILEKLAAERELLGSYLSGHPLDYVQIENDVTPVKTIREEAQDKQKFKVVVVPSIITERTTKKKKKWASLTLEDKSGTIEAVMWPAIFDKYFQEIDKTQPVEMEIGTEVLQEESGRLVNAKVISVKQIRKAVSPKPRVREVDMSELADIRPGNREVHLLVKGKNVTWDLGYVRIGD